MEDKADAMIVRSSPNDVSTLRTFLNMVHYYLKFLPNSSILLKAFHKLLQKAVCFHWSKICERSYAADASPRSLCAVISHILPENTEKPIQFA